MKNKNVLGTLESKSISYGNHIKVTDLLEYIESIEGLGCATFNISSSYNLTKNGYTNAISNGVMYGILMSVYYKDIELLKLESELRDYSAELSDYKIQGFESIEDIKSLIESILDLEHAKEYFALATQSLVDKNIEHQQALSEFKNSHSSVEVRYNTTKKD